MFATIWRSGNRDRHARDADDLSGSIRLVVVMVRLDIDLAAFPALDHRAVGVVMADIDQQFGLASAAPIGFVAAALSQRLAGCVDFDARAFCVFGAYDDHVKLRHWAILMCRFWNTPYSAASRKSVS